jgi:DNA topoisomerase-1
MSDTSEVPMLVDTRQAAQFAGLSYATTDQPGLRRRRSGRGFSYRNPGGEVIGDRDELRRIRSLAIPPAWKDVWICPDPNGHIQAVGFDEKGRKQYRYHPKFREVREGVKFEHVVLFAEALPELRRRIAADMAAPGLGRAKVLATVVHLLETTMIRIGNASYAKANKSYGLTTLLARHVKIDGAELRFHFKGKSGKTWRLSVRDRRVARIVKGCQELPGQHLFQYLDEAGQRQIVTSTHVNAYLKAASGADITAKDFRTWTGTVLAAMALSDMESGETLARARKNVTQAIERVASCLGNTPSICRKCYVHPQIVSAYLDGRPLLTVRNQIEIRPSDDVGALRPEEQAVLTFLRNGLVGRSTRQSQPAGGSNLEAAGAA